MHKKLVCNDPFHLVFNHFNISFNIPRPQVEAAVFKVWFWFLQRNCSLSGSQRGRKWKEIWQIEIPAFIFCAEDRSAWCELIHLASKELIRRTFAEPSILGSLPYRKAKMMKWPNNKRPPDVRRCEVERGLKGLKDLWNLSIAFRLVWKASLIEGKYISGAWLWKGLTPSWECWCPSSYDDCCVSYMSCLCWCAIILLNIKCIIPQLYQSLVES